MRRSDLARWFDASPNPYMILDRDLRYVAANQAYLEVTGSDLDALLGHHIFELFPNDPGDPLNEPRSLLEESFEKVLRTGERDVLAYIPYRVARTPDGEPELRIWSATHTPLLDETGAVEAILQHTEDVTELHRSGGTPAALLSRAEKVQRDYVEVGERLRSLMSTVDQAPGFMALLRGHEHVFEFANRAYLRLTGGRTLSGKGFEEALPELSAQGYRELLDQVWITGEAFVGKGMRAELEQPGGARDDVYIDIVFQPIVDDDGRRYGVLIQGHEVTEQIRDAARNRFRALASEQLARARDEVDDTLVEVGRAAVETIADWAFVDRFEDGQARRLVAAHADPGDGALSLRAMKCHLDAELPESHPFHGLGVAPKLLARVDDETLAALSASPEHYAVMKEVAATSLLVVPLSSRGRLYGLLTLATASNRPRFALEDVAFMADLGGTIGTVLDNVELARDRASLLAAAEEARERAEAANRAKDDFLAMLGHELRNPLSPILTAAHLLRTRKQAPDRELDIIERQANHLVRLVDDMLDVSRIVHGKLELRRRAVAIDDVVTNAVEMATPAIEAGGHRLVRSPVPEGLRVDGDAARLAQVVANLLTNAARYTQKPGEIAVTVSTEGAQVVIAVRDQGVGIAPDMLPRIFDMFTQAPQPADRSRGGLGLGLTLVKQLVDLHGGRVTAESEGLGCGTRVAVWLPLLDGRSSDHDEEPPPSLRGEGLRILIVDDNVDAAQLLGEVMTFLGHDIELVYDGLEAVEVITSSAFDVAILDIGLPGIDGYEVARRAKSALGADCPRLIALSGYGGVEDRARSAEAGFEEHLHKPVDTKVLVALLGESALR